MKPYWDKIHPELSNFTSKKLRDQASRVQKRKADRETAENNSMLQHYNENMVNNTGNNVPAPEQEKEHQPSSTVNHVTQELNDTDALKEKRKNIFERNYQYYIERELKDRVIPTKANKKIKLNIFKNTNEITSTHLRSIENMQYPPAVNLLQRNYERYSNTQTRKRKSKMDCQP